MTNILLSGANGNMGRAVTRTVENNDKVKITAGYDINTVKNSDFPVYDNLHNGTFRRADFKNEGGF